MAGDWIKMRADLFTHPKVVRISSALKADTLRTVGGLMSVWCLFDAHSIDGRLEGYRPETLDDHLRWPGFSAAMIAVRWLEDDCESLVLPEFDTHNGASAKRRAQDADRKREVRKTSAGEADKKRTREEKSNKSPPTPHGGESQPAEPKAKRGNITLADYLSQCRDAQAEPIPESDAVWAYPDTMGLPREYIPLAWWAFQGRYIAGKGEKAKRYTSWPQAFRNAVRENWLHLWWLDQRGGYALTTAGQQAKREMAAVEDAA